jgi:glutathione S-transferase
MEPTLLYGHPLGSSMGLVAALEWLAQPYRLSRVLMPDDMLDAGYARLNGRQETPVLITEDKRVLSETMAIALWLEMRDVDRRVSYAPGSAESDRLHQAMAFLNTGFTAAFSAYWVALEIETPDAAYQTALLRFGRAQVDDRHRKLEAMIGDTPYLVGDRPTLADAIFIGVARWADFHQAIEPAKYPRIAALRRRLDADPAVRFATAIENGESPVGIGAFRGHVALSAVPGLLAA